MRPTKLRVLRAVQQKQRSVAFESYLKVMNVLFMSHQSYEFVQTLQGYFRSKRYDLALKLADSLSDQKYPDATMHFVANQFSQLIRKYPWDPKLVSTDPELEAYEKFQKSERLCRHLNRKFSLYDSFRSPYEESLSSIRSFIQYVIGFSPNYENIFDNCDFGAGASVGVHGSATHLLKKISQDKWSVSASASSMAFLAVCWNHQLRDVLLDSRDQISCLDPEVARSSFHRRIAVVDYNKLSFVPKTAKTHRVIAVEPLLNGYIQKGVDVFMRRCLMRININLNNQSVNQRMARIGSLNDSDDSFVTIDLSSASDSISTGAIKSLFPYEWYSFLNDIRSKNYNFNGKTQVYHKFCSMGNGFCFPIQTLIFAAVCNSVGSGKPGTDFSVYGDDIIVRKKFAPEVLRLLKVLGFSPNTKKTFLQGPFRESCGSDWFGGVDVRPYTLHYELDSLESLFKFLNLTRRNSFCSVFFEEAREYIFSLIPPLFRFTRPYQGNSDSGIDNQDGEFQRHKYTHFDKKRQHYMWLELSHRSVSDRRRYGEDYRRDSVDMYALLRGSQSERYKVVYTLRRKTRTAIVRFGYSGATSMWLPSMRF